MDISDINVEETEKNFHKLYYYTVDPAAGCWWFGEPIYKSPFDMWSYQEIISTVKPDLILETGTCKGGSAWFFAHMLDLVGNPDSRVITCDINRYGLWPSHPKITYILGSSTGDVVLQVVKRAVAKAKTVMVSLDSNHEEQHVLNELRIYSQFVTKGSFLVCEDGNINGHPVYPEHGPGPAEALEKFLKENSDFVPDKSRERFHMTYHPDGWLKKV